MLRRFTGISKYTKKSRNNGIFISSDFAMNTAVWSIKKGVSTMSRYEVWLQTIIHGRGILYRPFLNFITGKRNVPVVIMRAQMRFSLKTVSYFLARSVKKNNGYMIRNGTANQSTSQ